MEINVNRKIRGLPGSFARYESQYIHVSRSFGWKSTTKSTKLPNRSSNFPLTNLRWDLFCRYLQIYGCGNKTCSQRKSLIIFDWKYKTGRKPNRTISSASLDEKYS